MMAIFLGLFALSASAVPPLKLDPKEPKIDAKFQERLDEAPPGQKMKVWIFFTDKEIFSEPALKEAVAKAGLNFTERAINRRQNRTGNAALFDFYDLPVSQEYVEALENAGLEVIYRSRWLNAVSAFADLENIEAAESLPFVYEIKPVTIMKKTPSPSNVDNILPEIRKLSDTLPDSIIARYGPSYTQLHQINIPVMHRLGYKGTGILIAIFDTGFDFLHPAFANLNLIDKYDFINNDTSVGETLESPRQPTHGTYVLSVIGGYADSSLIGPAYDADYLVAKTELIDVEIIAEEHNWEAAAEWADSLGADIISSSLGYSDWYTYYDLDGQTAVTTIAAEIAVSRGITVCNAAGNERQKEWHFVTPPADGPSVIAVGAVTSSGVIAPFSSVGPTYDGRIKPDLVAMGVDVYMATYGSATYHQSNGTSYSTPLTAGAAALILEAHPDWTPGQLKEALIKSADRYNNPDTVYGYGLFDAFVAADLLKMDSIPPIFLAVGDSININVTAPTILDSINMTSVNLPPTAIFTDLGDGNANLRYTGRAEDVGSRKIKFYAGNSLVSVSREVTFTVEAKSRIAVGPNPFLDSLTIFIGSAEGAPREISIYTVNGEKVWDKFADTYNDETGTIIWKGVNNEGLKLASGVYLVYIETAKRMEKVKVFKK